MNKRDFLKNSLLAGTGIMTVGLAGVKASNILANDMHFNTEDGMYTLPPLPYAYNALEPFIDEATMKLHHDIHHNGYVKGLNKATEAVNEAIAKNDYGLIKHWERIVVQWCRPFFAFYFWQIMGPKQGQRSSMLENGFIKDFGSFDAFKAYFVASANAVEGSGWGILAYEPLARKMVILQAEKHNNLSQMTSIPIMVVDVWEHAYYLKYQNKRKDYVEAFFNVINWDAVSKRYEMAIK